MTVLHTRLARPREIFWSIVISALAGIGAFFVTYHVLGLAFAPTSASVLIAPARAAEPHRCVARLSADKTRWCPPATLTVSQSTRR